MTNKALEALQNMLPAGDAQADALHAQTLEDERGSYDRLRSSDEPSALTPEALVTAVGVGWLLGPVGGVLSGLAQGFLGKRAEQDAIDAYDKEHNIRHDANEMFNTAWSQEESLTDDPLNHSQLDGIRAMWDMGINNSGSSFADTQELGAQQMSEAGTAFLEYQKENERQAVEDRALMDAETNARFNDLKGDFRTDTVNFEAQIRTADNIIEALNRGDGAAITAALASMPLLVNPDAGATSEGEVNIWQGIEGFVKGLQGTLQRELRGGGLKDSTTKQLLGTALQYKRNAITWQQAIQARYGEFLVTEDIPQERWKFFNKTDSIPGYQGGGFISRDVAVPNLQDGGDESLGTKTFDAVQQGKSWWQRQLDDLNEHRNKARQ